jgi:cell division protein FtsB
MLSVLKKKYNISAETISPVFLYCLAYTLHIYLGWSYWILDCHIKSFILFQKQPLPSKTTMGKLECEIDSLKQSNASLKEEVERLHLVVDSLTGEFVVCQSHELSHILTSGDWKLELFCEITMKYVQRKRKS